MSANEIADIFTELLTIAEKIDTIADDIDQEFFIYGDYKEKQAVIMSEYPRYQLKSSILSDYICNLKERLNVFSDRANAAVAEKPTLKAVAA